MLANSVLNAFVNTKYSLLREKKVRVQRFSKKKISKLQQAKSMESILPPFILYVACLHSTLVHSHARTINDLTLNLIEPYCAQTAQSTLILLSRSNISLGTAIQCLPCLLA